MAEDAGLIDLPSPAGGAPDNSSGGRLLLLGPAGSFLLALLEDDMKSQFISTEDLRITFPAFYTAGGTRITGTDVASVVIKRPDNTLLPSPPVPVFDTDVDYWVATVPFASFQEGEWLIKASSDNSLALDQYKSLYWGDYVDDIPETRQAALGRWKIIGTQLFLYEDDGLTIFKTYNLKDAGGLPTNITVFERDPV